MAPLPQCARAWSTGWGGLRPRCGEAPAGVVLDPARDILGHRRGPGRVDRKQDRVPSEMGRAGGTTLWALHFRHGRLLQLSGRQRDFPGKGASFGERTWGRRADRVTLRCPVPHRHAPTRGASRGWAGGGPRLDRRDGWLVRGPRHPQETPQVFATAFRVAHLPSPFWRKANTFRELVEFLLSYVATIKLAYTENLC